MKLYFTDPEHEKAFKLLRDLRDPLNRNFCYSDYMYGYYVLTADQKLRTFLNMFLDKISGDIEWGKMLTSKIIDEDYRQVIAFAHQLYSAGWNFGKFDFIQLLSDIRGKQDILETVLAVTRLYGSENTNWWEAA